MDLQEYYISTEWDVMNVPAIRNEKYYPCCEEPYPDIFFYIKLRRKSLFYTVNVIIPCVGISFLSVLVFHLPSDSGEKVRWWFEVLLTFPNNEIVGNTESEEDQKDKRISSRLLLQWHDVKIWTFL